MALSPAKKASDARHHTKLDQIMIRPYKEEGAAIRTAAAAAGMSVQSYILQAIRAWMSQKPSSDAPQKAIQQPQSTDEYLARLHWCCTSQGDTDIVDSDYEVIDDDSEISSRTPSMVIMHTPGAEHGASEVDWESIEQIQQSRQELLKQYDEIKTLLEKNIQLSRLMEKECEDKLRYLIDQVEGADIPSSR